MREEERKKKNERMNNSAQILYYQWKNNLVNNMVAQEYHLSLNDLVPRKGLGKLKQTPEKLVNKSEE